jgi:MYXO-CTERM domain-containing protein
MKKTTVAKTIAIMLGSVAAASAQFPFGPTPYTNVVPNGNFPPYANRTNLNVNYWSTGAGWADATGVVPGISIVLDTNAVPFPGAAPAGEQWSTTDPYDSNNFTGDVGVLQSNAFTDVNGNPADPATGGQSFNFGGSYAAGNSDTNNPPTYDPYVPGITNPSYYRTWTPNYNDANAVWTFAEFAIIGPSATRGGVAPPQATFTNEDAFGFSLWNGAPGVGTALAEFKFGRQYTMGASTNDPDRIGFAWFLNGVQQDTNMASGLTADWAILYNQVYRLNVSVDTNNLMNVSLDTINSGGNFVTNTSFITNGAIGAGTTWMDYNTISIDWALASGVASQPGFNYINVNTVEVVATTVPEPGTWAIGALLLGGLAARIYRRRQAAAQS